jgi:hypothetical protein
MDSVNRGRSLSAHSNHIRHSTSASPHPDPASSFVQHNDNSFAGVTQHATNGAFGDATFSQDFSQQAQYSMEPDFTNNSFDAQLNNTADSAFLQSQNFQNLSPNQTDNSFPSFDLSQTDFNQPTSLDPSLLDFNSNDLNLLQSQQGTNLNHNNNNNLDPMAATMQSHSSTPPHLLPNDAGRRLSGSPSSGASPGYQQTNMSFGNGMTRPRNASESLDPSSAMFPQGQNEWMGMGGYRSHQRTPSDAHSDISSNHASPYMGTLGDSFDIAGSHSSPLLNPAQDPTFNDGLGLQSFNLNENNHFSPGHSPGHSPHIMPQPQHALPPFTAENNFGLNLNTNVFNNNQQQQNNGLDMFPGLGQEPFPSLNTQGSSPNSQTFNDHMSPPEINIVHAEPTRVEDPVRGESSQDALSPPLRSMFGEMSQNFSRKTDFIHSHRPPTSEIRFSRRHPLSFSSSQCSPRTFAISSTFQHRKPFSL